MLVLPATPAEHVPQAARHSVIHFTFDPIHFTTTHCVIV